jgi:hypothetical protein
MATTPSLPVSLVVDVSVQLTPAGAQAQSLSDLLVVGTSPVIDGVERFRTYATLSAVALDFGLISDEYKCAQKWFSQTPQPKQIVIGRYFSAASRGGLRGGTLSAAGKAITAWQAITNGAFRIAKNGAAAADITGLNFAGAANLNAVAGIIASASGMLGTSVTWNAGYGRFEFESTATGPTSSLSFLTAPGSGTDISSLLRGTQAAGAYLYAGQPVETALAAVTALESMLSQRFYGLAVPGVTDANVALGIAAFIEGTNSKHTYWVTTQDANALNASSTSDLPYLLAQLGYKRTFSQYSSSDANAAVSAAARLLTTDYRASNTVITLKFKQEPGVAAEQINAGQAATLKAKRCNVFVAYENDTAILQEGVMSDGNFADVVAGTDWLATDIQRSIYNLLYSSTTKIPQTNQGMQLLTTAAEASCSQGAINGLLAPGVWNAGGFGLLKQGDYLPKGYYVYAPSVDTQNQADRAARMAVPIQVAAKLAGAIHTANVLVNVNQ